MSQQHEVLQMENITTNHSEQEQVQHQPSEVAHSDLAKIAENEEKVEVSEHEEKLTQEKPRELEEKTIVKDEKAQGTEEKSHAKEEKPESVQQESIVLDENSIVKEDKENEENSEMKKEKVEVVKENPQVLGENLNSNLNISTLSTVSIVSAVCSQSTSTCSKSKDAGNTTITSQPSSIREQIVSPSFQFGPNPIRMECPYCREVMSTHVECHNTAAKNSLLALLCFSVICCPCSCYLCCSETYRKTKHYCKKCDSFLGMFVDQ